MNKNGIVDFYDRQTIEEEAAAWLIKLDSDSPISDDELASLREWCQRTPSAHRDSLRDLAVLWNKLNILTELAVPLEAPKQRKKVEGYLQPATYIAAACVLLVVAVFQISTDKPDPISVNNGLYATVVGEQKRTELVDGSVVLLNTNSQVRVDYKEDFRDIFLLQGEAHFTVTNNKNRPFRVYAGNGKVQAIGTGFSVYIKDNKVNVMVTEGQVSVATIDTPALSMRALKIEHNKPNNHPPTSHTMLVAGQTATIQSVDNNPVATQVVVRDIETYEVREIDARLSWREGVLTFTGKTLEQVVEEISRYTTISIEIHDPAVKNIRIGGRFPVGETEAMLDTLKSNFDLEVTRINQHRVVISKLAN